MVCRRPAEDDITVMPIYRMRRFRLVARLPLSVVSKGVTYSLTMVPVPVSDQWHLSARWPGGHWLVAYAGGEEALREMIYAKGVELQPATVARMIFDQLVKDGRAESMPGPARFGLT